MLKINIKKRLNEKYSPLEKSILLLIHPDSIMMYASYMQHQNEERNRGIISRIEKYVDSINSLIDKSNGRNIPVYTLAYFPDENTEHYWNVNDDQKLHDEWHYFTQDLKKLTKYIPDYDLSKNTWTLGDYFINGPLENLLINGLTKVYYAGGFKGQLYDRDLCINRTNNKIKEASPSCLEFVPLDEYIIEHPHKIYG